MKNHRFPWLRNRTTDNRKCEKARNIKEKRTIEMFNTVSKQLVALRSSASDNQFLRIIIWTFIPRNQYGSGGFFCNIFLVLLLGLSGRVILSVPSLSRGRKYFWVKFFVFLYPQCSAISAFECGCEQKVRILMPILSWVASWVVLMMD